MTIIALVLIVIALSQASPRTTAAFGDCASTAARPCYISTGERFSEAILIRRVEQPAWSSKPHRLSEKARQA